MTTDRMKDFNILQPFRLSVAILWVWLIINSSVYAQNFWQYISDSPSGVAVTGLVMDSLDYIYAGTNGQGVYNGGLNGLYWRTISAGLTNLEVLSLAMKYLDGLNYIFAGTTDVGEGGIFRLKFGWERVTKNIYIDYVNAIAINAKGDIFAGTFGDGVIRSTDNGDTWVYINENIDSDVFALAINDDGEILAGTNGGAGIYRSSNNGDTWVPTNSGLTSNRIRAIATYHKYVFVGSDDRDVFRSIDNGKTWALFNTGLLNANVESLIITKSGHVFAGTIGGGIFGTTVDGESWTSLNTGLTNTSVLSFVINSSGYVFAGTNGGGVFRSTKSTNPALVVSPVSLNLGSDLSSERFNITNSNLGILTWTLSDDQAWINVNPIEGTTTTETDPITVTIDRRGLTPGPYSGKVTINSNGGTKIVDVSMIVLENPILSVTPSNLDFGISTTALAINIANAGTGTLNWTAKGDPNWITINPDRGVTTTAPSQVTVTVNRSGLGPGTHKGTVTITPASGAPATIPVTMVVPESPVLIINPPVLDFDSTKTSLNFAIINSGTGTLTWTISDDQSWIATNPPNGSNLANESKTITVTVDRRNLAPGSYTGKITVTSNVGTKDVLVNLFRPKVLSPPLIFHAAPALAQIRTLIQIEAIITDNTGVANASLVYRKSGDPVFQNVSMFPSGNRFRGDIPASTASDSGVDYRIIAIDNDGETQYAPSASGFYSIQVLIPEPGIDKKTPQQGGYESTAYRLISVPLEADRPDPKDVLLDNLPPRIGPDGKAEWRLIALKADQSYAEYEGQSSAEFLMAPGKAFWLIVRETLKSFNTGGGKSKKTDKSATIKLDPKWNFVGNPFNFRIPISKLSLKSAKTVEIRSFDGVWNDPVSRPVTEIRPFEGYAVYNSNPASVDTLFMNPDFSASGNMALKENKAHSASGVLWSIQIVAESQAARDIDNFILIHPQASPDRDDYDQAEPPVIGDYVSVYFPYPQQAQMREIFCVDARPEPTTGDIWEFEVKTHQRKRVDLSFVGLEHVPPQYEIWLLDDALQVSQNLRKVGHYALATGGLDQPKRLKLMVGNTSFIKEKHQELNASPSGFELSQNFPNPFNPVTTIRYGLPHAERVTLKIYDLLGNEVVTLVNKEWRAAGYHVAIWDGQNQKGRLVASGIYFYQLQTEGLSMIKKMVYVQ